VTPKRRLTPWMIGVGIVTFLAGLLFGYDQGVIGGALNGWKLQPETKGRTLEQIQQMWTAKVAARKG